MELAGPASSFFLDDTNLLNGDGEVRPPTQIKLSNPFLGNTCYDGSNSDPIQIKYTTGTTSPPPPNEPLEGKPGGVFSTNEGAIAHIVEGKLVDNSFAAPGVTGCGVAGSAELRSTRRRACPRRRVTTRRSSKANSRSRVPKRRRRPGKVVAGTLRS